jgi:predicted AAA+ superfamily ATPase
VASELLKARVHRGLDGNLHFWRDRSGHEIDLLIGPDEALVPIEVKSGSTIPSDARRAIRGWTDLAGDSAGTGMFVYGGDESFTRAGVRHVGWRDLPDAF